jgi:hypothetical protein
MNTEPRDLSNNDLLEQLKRLKAQEDALLTDLLRHISELERRRLYFKLGFTSLFGYLTQGLGYSDGEAYRRVESSRLLSAHPEIESTIEEGKLTLSNLVEVSNAIRNQERSNGLKLTKVERLNLLNKVTGKSQREAQRELATALPNIALKFEERTRERMDGSLEITVLLSPDQRRRLDNAKGILAHSGPIRSNAEAIDRLSNFFLRKKDFTRGFVGADETLHQEKSPPVEGPEAKRPRAISANLRRAVFRRDGGKCQHRLERGKICGSTYQIELDHIIPVSKGGKSKYENLRCLCRVHNQWKSDAVLEEQAEQKDQ